MRWANKPIRAAPRLQRRGLLPRHPGAGGGSAGFVLVALFFVACVGSAFVCVGVFGAFIVAVLFDVACCGIVQGT